MARPLRTVWRLAVKAWMNECDKKVDLFTKCIKFLQAAADAVSKHITTHDKKVQHSSQQAAKKEENERARKRKIAEAEQNAKRAKGDTGTAFLIQASHDVIKPVKTFDTAEKLAEAKDAGTLGTSEPYIVKSMPAVAALVDERSVKASLGVFRIQFPSNGQAVKDGRGYTPFHNERRDRLRELMLSAGPACVVDVKKDGVDNL
eukprot:1687485-Pyramimonas_sp.AAC.1